MDGDLTSKINEIKALTEENNKMLKSIRRHGRFAAIMRIFYWLILIGIGIGSYYYLQPFLDPLVSTYKNIVNVEGKIGNIPESFSNLKNFFDGPSQNQGTTTEMK